MGIRHVTKSFLQNEANEILCDNCGLAGWSTDRLINEDKLSLLEMTVVLINNSLFYGWRFVDIPGKSTGIYCTKCLGSITIEHILPVNYPALSKH